MNPRQQKLVTDVYVAPRYTRPEQRAVFKATRPQQYVSDIVAPSVPSRSPQPYARFYRPAADPVLKKPEPRPAPVPAERPLALQAVSEARPRPSQHYAAHAAKRRRTSKGARRTANALIVVAVVMSFVMGGMIYRYHLALQKVEALPLQSNESAETHDPASTAEAPAVTALSEAKPKSGGGGGGKLAPSTPYKLSIPKLGVSANILGVGTTKSGAINVPGNIWQVGWYKTSATPADNTGVVVLNGHVHGPTQPGVFANLTKLNPGDTLSVTDVSGKSYSYKVVSKQTIKAGEAGDEVLQSGSATKQGLNLVTCTGKIVEDKYQDRLVVYTERV